MKTSTRFVGGGVFGGGNLRRRFNLEQLDDRRLLSAMPQLIEINSTGIGSNPSELVAVGEDLFFTANDSLHGTALVEE